MNYNIVFFSWLSSWVLMVILLVNFQDCPRAEDKILDNSAGIFQSSGSGGMGNQPAELPVPRCGETG
jgi:hypothetical protein